MERFRTAHLAVLVLCLLGATHLISCRSSKQGREGLSLSGVSLRDPESSFEYTGDIVAHIEPGKAVSQTVVSRRPGLVSATLWLRKVSSQASDAEILSVSLFHSNEDPRLLARVQIPYRRISKEFPIEVVFPLQKDPPNQTYLIRLETQGSPVAVYGRSEDAYPDGELYLGAKPQEADMAFRLSYNYGLRAIWDDIHAAAPHAWLVIPLVLLILAPGSLALCAIEGRSNPITMDWGQRFGLGVGLSLGSFPLLMLWAGTFGLCWGAITTWLVYGLAALSLGGIIISRLRNGWRPLKPDRIDLALLGLFITALGVRLAMTRDLAAPAWVDPVHHTTIVRLIIEHGSYPTSYAPYVDANTASYHPGFHALVAALHWMTGLELDQAMLLFGQVLNALTVPAMYLLTTSLTKNRKAGFFSALIAGFFTPMPAYYTSWGRYTQIAGLVILPTAAALMIRLLESQILPGRKTQERESAERDGLGVQGYNRGSGIGQSNGLQLIILNGLAAAGLFLVHYRVAGFWALLLIAYYIGELVHSLDKQPIWRTIPPSLGWVLAVAFTAVLISLPWWRDLLQTMLLPRLARPAISPQALKIDWGYLTPAYGVPALWLAAAGLLLSLLRAQFFGPSLVLWVVMLFIAANRGSIHIPGAGMINLTSVEIMLFMPIAALGGYALAEAVRLLQKAARRLHRIRGELILNLLLGFSVLISLLLGSRKLLPILNPTTLLFREADRKALEWIAANTPADSKFLINPFLWGYGVYAGQDGGYWITPLTGRSTMPPNLLYDMGTPESARRVRLISQKTLDLADDPAGLSEIMENEGICYAYLGRRGGVLSAKKLANSGFFQTLYSKDGAWVFIAMTPNCPSSTP